MNSFEFEIVNVNPQGEEISRVSSQAQYHLEPIATGVILEMVALGGGTFIMGSPRSEAGCTKSQIPQHPVTLNPFYIAKYPITQAQWQAVAKLPQINRQLNPQPSNFEDPHRPVEQISWYDAVEWCDRLSQETNLKYRLPSEAEWEYACRAKTTTPFHFGETITTNLANYSGVDWEYLGKICSQGAYGAGPLGDDRRETTPVGHFALANPFGLFDMHGNVREWCADYWHENYQEAPTDGSVWLQGGDANLRVLRGGSWNGGPKKCRSASRANLDPETCLYDVGFRVGFSLSS